MRSTHTARHAISRTILGAAVASCVLLFAACNDNTSSTPQTQGPAEKTGQDAGRAVDNAATNTASAVQGTADRTRDAMNNATTAPGSDTAVSPTGNGNYTASGSSSSLPSLPSVTGTNVNNLSTADAAAQRLLDALQQEAAKPNNQSKVNAIIDELKGMKNSLSADFQAKVDAAVKLASAGTTTPPADANSR